MISLLKTSKVGNTWKIKHDIQSTKTNTTWIIDINARGKTVSWSIR